MRPKFAILIPHFQTLTLTLLCLRLIRLRTCRRDYEVVVIDNGSTDGSGERLADVRWIRLLRRELTPDEWPARSHGLALNLGVQETDAPFVVVFHTDTMVLRGDWLDFLVDNLEAGGSACGVVGSWKMESRGPLRRAGKTVEGWWRRLWGRAPHQAHYPRSHCALYRREAMATRPAMFDPSRECSAGEELHHAMEQAGRRCRFVAPGELGKYVRHLNHATMALNQQFGLSDRYMPRTRARSIRRIQEFFHAIGAEQILADHSLDR